MIDAMFQAGTDQALDDQVARPKPFQPEAPKFSLGQALLGVPQGVASGSTKTAAFAAEILGAFGQTEAATGTVSAGGMFATQTPEERKQAEEARRRVLENDNLFSNEVGDELRRRAKDVMPDPNSTHAAAQVVAGVTEFATQAVGYAAGAGPVAPLLLGADVGMAEADKLRLQGVDVATRTKAGAVAGVAAGVSVALPVAVPGSVAKTAALVVAGGPGGFIAQNAAEKAILANAGYDKIASQYDPLDPVGLALSTIVPAGFGAAAVRGARVKAAPTLKEVVLGIESGGRRFDEKGNVLTSPKGAKGEMQVMDATNLDPGFGVRPASDNSLAERARVGSDYLDAMLKRYGGDEAKAMAAYNAGPGALDAALKKGGDWLSHLPAETQAYVKKGMDKLAGGRTDAAARSAIAADADTVAAARVRQTGQTIDSYRLTPDSDIAGMTAHQDAMESAHAMLARGEPVQVSDIIRPYEPAPLPLLRDGEPVAMRLPNGEEITLVRTREQDGAVRNPDAPAEAPDNGPARLAAIGSTGKEVGFLSYSERPGLEPVIQVTEGSRRKGVATALYDVAEANGAVIPEVGAKGALRSPEGQAFREGRAAKQAAQPAARVSATVDGVRALQDVLPERPAPATGRQLFEAAGESALPAAKPSADADSAALKAQTDAAIEANPDIMVQLDGMDAPMRAEDMLEQLRKEVADDNRDASLLDVAANCFLRTA